MIRQTNIMPTIDPQGTGLTTPARRAIPVLTIFVLALGVRLTFLAGIEAYPKFELIRNRFDDQVVFDAWAKAIVDGRDFDYSAMGHDIARWSKQFPGVFPQSPLYAYYLATQYRVFGFRYDLVRVFQMLLGAIGCALLYRLARRFATPGAAFLCAAAASLYGPFVFYEATFLRAGLLTATTIAVLYFVALIAERQRPPALLGLTTGVTLAAAVLLRPNYIFFALPALAWLWWSNRAAIASVVLLSAGLLTPLLFVAAVNTARSGQLSGLSSNGSFVFVACNLSDPRRADSPLDQLRASATAGDVLAVIAREARRDPAAFVAMQVDKVRKFFALHESPNNLSYAMARKTNPWLSIAWVDFSWILPLALAGFLISLRRPRRFTLLYLFLGTYTLSTLAFCVHGRLRQPAAVVLLIFAAVAIDAWLGALRRRRLLPALASAAAVVGIWITVHPLAPRYRESDYKMAAAAYFSLGEDLERAGRSHQALAPYSRAVSLNPSYEKALARIAALQKTLPPEPVPLPVAALELCDRAREAAERGEPENALALLRQARSIAPRAALPHQYLSNVYFLLGRRDRAMQHLEKAVELQPLISPYRSSLQVLRNQ
jgi:4-amino-4-deoxy-L-arabinose transferase-like glycosyltransferase